MIRKILRMADFKELPGLFWLVLKHPLFIIPTLEATKLTMQIAQREYGEKHKGNTAENAFRHALWSFIIAKKCLKWNNNIPKVLRWVKLITEKHEVIAPNPPLERAMDEHNNVLGMQLFEQSPNWEIAKAVSHLKTAITTAKKIEKPSEADSFGDELVYIT